MRISHQWLKQYVDITIAPRTLAERLSMAGLEVENVEDQAKPFENFVVGLVKEVRPHPNANRLTVCVVDVGGESLQVVCGAPNVATGQKVAVGRAGATVPRNQHDPEGKPFTLSRTTIRGVESDGMICSEYELGLGDDAQGILVLQEKASVGTPLAKHLRMTDTIYDIEVTANRGDWMSHIGVAREVSALTGRAWRRPAIKLKESRRRAEAFATIRIADRKNCPRYCGRVLFGVKIAPSPNWMQDRLIAVGIRPINNVVDITNFVLMETGHPLHAFDYDRLAGHAIVVKRAAAGDRFTTLDGKERTLRSDTLMICDSERPIAVAGIMGGANTEISDSTTNVLLESAFFDPSSVRRTAKALGLSTEASQRFERTADVEMARYAVDRASQLMAELAAAEVLRGVLDVYPGKKRPRTVRLRVTRANEILGTSLSIGAIQSHLKSLSLPSAQVTKNVLAVSIPSYRNDLVQEIDLIEEVARMVGYDAIDTTMRATIDFSTHSEGPDVRSRFRSHFVGAGFNEILAPSLQSRPVARLEGQEPIEVLNPVSQEMSALRTSLLPGVLQVIRHNMNQSSKDLRFFEFGHVFGWSGKDWGTLDDVQEEERLLVALTGSRPVLRAGLGGEPYSIFDIKGELEAFLSKFFLDNNRLICYDSEETLTVENVGVEIQGTYAGHFGMVRREVCARFDIDQDVYVAELVVGRLKEHFSGKRSFSSLPRYPSVRRDLAFIVAEPVPSGDVESAIRRSAGEILESVELFDLYTGAPLDAGKKSLAYTLVFQPTDRTLTDADVDAVVASIVRGVRQACGGELRA